MSLLDSLLQNPFLDTNSNDPTSEIFPEPGFIITIEPTLFNGDASPNGHQVLINGFSQPVVLLTITITNVNQITVLTFKDQTTLELNDIFITSLNCENFLFERLGGANINITLNNTLMSGYDIESPLIDLFQSGFICSIYMNNPFNQSDQQALFVGFLQSYKADYSIENVEITLPIESFLQVLSRSTCVQTQTQQTVGGIPIQSFTTQLLNFNNLLNGLLNETIIAQSLYSVQYLKAPGETEAIGENGSAIGINTNMYIDTPYTDSKLNVILRSLYPYQRVFYVDNAGNFIITPLQSYFDDTEGWYLTFADQTLTYTIPIISMEVLKNTGTIQNRTSLSFLQISQQFALTNTTSPIPQASSVIAVATPQENAGFNRLNDFIKSTEYLQTFTAVQEINNNLINNSGLFNMALNFNNITGLVNKSIVVDDNTDLVKTSNQDQDNLKYYLRLYSAKALAEQLFQETQITVDISLNLIYNQNTGVFRTIPLNQLVSMPHLNNNLLNGEQAYFCYGYDIRFNTRTGSVLRLYLTKAYTYTALWSDDQLQVLNVSDFT